MASLILTPAVIGLVWHSPACFTSFSRDRLKAKITSYADIQLDLKHLAGARMAGYLNVADNTGW